MAEITLLLGANRGDPQAIFARAASLIEDHIGPVQASSRDHWTAPWGFDDPQLFLNRALLVDTPMDPRQMMELLLNIEQELGRERIADTRYSPRTIDIDMLFVGETVIKAPNLVVPHPRVHQRAFALAPAADLVPGLVHPQLGRTVLQLLNDVIQQP